MRKVMLIYHLAIPLCLFAIIFLWNIDNYAQDNVSEKEMAKLSQGIADKSPDVRSYSIKTLLSVLSSSKEVIAGTETKKIIESEFHRNVNKEMILLAGLAEVDSLLGDIQNMAYQPLEKPKAGRFYGTDQWAANLVLARKGDKSSINKLIDFAKEQDFHTQVVFVLQDFQYVPQPQIVSYLLQFLESDERLEPVKPTVPGIPVANYAAASLARILTGFPVEFKEDYSYTREEIDICRKWMANQKEWQFK